LQIICTGKGADRGQGEGKGERSHKNIKERVTRGGVYRNSRGKDDRDGRSKKRGENSHRGATVIKMVLKGSMDHCHCPCHYHHQSHSLYQLCSACVTLPVFPFTVTPTRSSPRPLVSEYRPRIAMNEKEKEMRVEIGVRTGVEWEQR
jgi:hypothetical protein